MQNSVQGDDATVPLHYLCTFQLWLIIPTQEVWPLRLATAKHMAKHTLKQSQIQLSKNQNLHGSHSIHIPCMPFSLRTIFMIHYEVSTFKMEERKSMQAALGPPLRRKTGYKWNKYKAFVFIGCTNVIFHRRQERMEVVFILFLTLSIRQVKEESLHSYLDSAT